MYLCRQPLKKIKCLIFAACIYSEGASLQVKSILLVRNISIARNIFRTEQIFAIIMAAVNVTLHFKQNGQTFSKRQHP